MLGHTIARLRKSRGLTQAKFAEALHVTQAAVSQWETGRTNPDVQQLFILADFFGITVEKLTSGAYVPASSPKENTPSSPIDSQIMKELEGADVELARDVLDYIKFKKQSRKE